MRTRLTDFASSLAETAPRFRSLPPSFAATFTSSANLLAVFHTRPGKSSACSTCRFQCGRQYSAGSMTLQTCSQLVAKHTVRRACSCAFSTSLLHRQSRVHQQAAADCRARRVVTVFRINSSSSHLSCFDATKAMMPTATTARAPRPACGVADMSALAVTDCDDERRRWWQNERGFALKRFCFSSSVKSWSMSLAFFFRAPAASTRCQRMQTPRTRLLQVATPVAR